MKRHDQDWRRLFCLGLPTALFFLLTVHTSAQGCAMCYQNAAASGARAQAALRHGILILLAPALAIFGGIFSVIYRRR